VEKQLLVRIMRHFEVYEQLTAAQVLPEAEFVEFCSSLEVTVVSLGISAFT